MADDPAKLPSPPLPRLAARSAESHKGDYGRALLIGGSLGMSGAISLSGMAALRSGTGLVTLAVPDSSLGPVAAHEASYMTIPLPADAAGRISIDARTKLASLVKPFTALGLGPGIGRSPELTELIAWLYTSLPQPLVVDADALNALSEVPNKLRQPGGPRIMTPHPGEFQRLIGEQLPPDQWPERAVQLAADCGVVIVLKGHRTLITDGQTAVRNNTGNPGMATGGAGDVLTGIVTALLAQGMPPRDAAHLGVYTHGLAGDLAAAELGQVSLIASDLVKYLPGAFQQVVAESGD